MEARRNSADFRFHPTKETNLHTKRTVKSDIHFRSTAATCSFLLLNDSEINSGKQLKSRLLDCTDNVRFSDSLFGLVCTHQFMYT